MENNNKPEPTDTPTERPHQINNNKQEYKLSHHELLDRMWILTDMYENYISNNPETDDIFSQEEKEQMSMFLNETYQMIGERVLNLYGNNVEVEDDIDE